MRWKNGADANKNVSRRIGSAFQLVICLVSVKIGQYVLAVIQLCRILDAAYVYFLCQLSLACFIQVMSDTQDCS